MTLCQSPEYLGFNLEMLVEVSLFSKRIKARHSNSCSCAHFALLQFTGHFFGADPSANGCVLRLLGQGPRCWWKSRQVAAIALGSAPGGGACLKLQTIFKPFLNLFELHSLNLLYLDIWRNIRRNGVAQRYFPIFLLCCMYLEPMDNFCRCRIVNKPQGNRREKDWSWSFLTGKHPALKNFASIGWKCLLVLAIILLAMFPFTKFHSSLNAFSIGVSPACALYKDVHRMQKFLNADIVLTFCFLLLLHYCPLHARDMYLLEVNPDVSCCSSDSSREDIWPWRRSWWLVTLTRCFPLRPGTWKRCHLAGGTAATERCRSNVSRKEILSGWGSKSAHPTPLIHVWKAGVLRRYVFSQVTAPSQDCMGYADVCGMPFVDSALVLFRVRVK